MPYIISDACYNQLRDILERDGIRHLSEDNKSNFRKAGKTYVEGGWNNTLQRYIYEEVIEDETTNNPTTQRPTQATTS